MIPPAGDKTSGRKEPARPTHVHPPGKPRGARQLAWGQQAPHPATRGCWSGLKPIGLPPPTHDEPVVAATDLMSTRHEPGPNPPLIGPRDQLEIRRVELRPPAHTTTRSAATQPESRSAANGRRAEFRPRSSSIVARGVHPGPLPEPIHTRITPSRTRDASQRNRL